VWLISSDWYHHHGCPEEVTSVCHNSARFPASTEIWSELCQVHVIEESLPFLHHPFFHQILLTPHFLFSPLGFLKNRKKRDATRLWAQMQESIPAAWWQVLVCRAKVKGCNTRIFPCKIPPSDTFVPKYIIPADTNPKSAFVQEIKSRREFLGPRSLCQGRRSQHHNSTMRHAIIPAKSLQIPIQNLHLFRRSRAEGRESSRFHHATRLIHHPCKY
jgi:hypothetical protein